MAGNSRENWIQFDEENDDQKTNEIGQSKPWPISSLDDKKFINVSSGSVTSISSDSSFMSIESESEPREDNSKYLAFKALETTDTETKEEDNPESYSDSNTDCKYSVFSSLRLCEDKGEYLGWSKKVLGEGIMSWSEQIRAKPAF